MMPPIMTTAALQQLPLWEEGAGDAGWRVRRSRRARRLGVRVFRDGTVEIVVPERVGVRQVESFVAHHRDWIEHHRRRAPVIDTRFPPPAIELPALGESWRLQVAEAGPVLRERREGVAGGTLEICAAGGSAVLRAALFGWLSAGASAALEPQLAGLAADLGLRYRRVQIRRQRTRWGSCSTRGTISLNCCLLFQRPAVVRYLLAHELAHLTHMNHSRRFWALVAQYEPQWRELDRELTAGWSQVPGWVLAALRGV
jgi:predicted metal-dependent hydrolase